MAQKESRSKSKELSPPPAPTHAREMLAKRDFLIHQNEHHIEIKAGDDVSGVPEKFWPNLITEGVI